MDVCVWVCVAQLLNRWNAHYAADDNSVESKVCAPHYHHFPLPLLPFYLAPSSLSSLSFSLSVAPPAFSSWVFVTLLCTPWLEASKDGYHISLCSSRRGHTHMHTHSFCFWLCVCVAGADWATAATFFAFFFQALKVFFCPSADRLCLRTTGCHAGGMQPPQCQSDSILL